MPLTRSSFLAGSLGVAAAFGTAHPGHAQGPAKVSIALDWEEFLSIFANGRGVVAHGPIPPVAVGGIRLDRRGGRARRGGAPLPVHAAVE